MIYDNILGQEWLNSIALPVTITLLAISFIIAINWQKAGKKWLERTTRQSLTEIGIDQKSNVVCPDGLEEDFVIDRLVLLHDSILIISFKPYTGNIYCARHIAEWTQIVGKKSFKFENPLFELENQIKAIKAIIPQVPVSGIVFFDHSARFPKGYPKSVLNPQNIPEYYIRSRCPEVQTQVLQAWDMLNNLLNESVSRQSCFLKLDNFYRKGQNCPR